MDDKLFNYYELIGVSATASADEVKAAFVAKAQPLIEAYQILTDRALRARYDESLAFQASDSKALTFDVRKELTGGRGVQDLLQNLIVTLDGRAVVTQEKITQRLLTRIPVDKDVAITLADGTALTGKLADLSGSGARLVVNAVLKDGQLVEIAVSPGEAPFAQAQVVRAASPGREYGVKWIHVFENRLPKGFLSKKTV